MNSPARKSEVDDDAPQPMDPRLGESLRDLIEAERCGQSIGLPWHVVNATHALLLDQQYRVQRVAELEAALRRVGETTLGQALALANEQKQRAEEAEARVRQLEERCALDAEDIREHRVTRAQVEAWASNHGWSRVIRARVTDERGATWWERAGKRDIQVREGANSLAYNIDEFAVADNRNAWDVLREMAAIQVPGTTN
jgi:hypothetical protein